MCVTPALHQPSTLPCLPCHADPPVAFSRSRAEQEFQVPAEIQQAVDAGNVDLVKEMLKTPPEGMSKALQKKLIKNSEIAAKKIEKNAAKGGDSNPPPSAPKAQKAEATGSSSAPSASKAPAARAAPTIKTGHFTPEDVIVTDLLACLKGLSLPEEAMAHIEEQRSRLSAAVAPRVNALRNLSYAEGFTSASTTSS